MHLHRANGHGDPCNNWVRKSIPDFHSIPGAHFDGFSTPNNMSMECGIFQKNKLLSKILLRKCGIKDFGQREFIVKKGSNLQNSDL